MKRTMIEKLPLQVGKRVVVKGWVHRVRALKNITFVVLRDRTGYVQCVLPKGTELSLETVVAFTGDVVSGKNDLMPCEVVVEDIQVYSEPVGTLPVQINSATLEVQLDTLLNHRVLTLRHAREQAVFKVQEVLLAAFRLFLKREGFYEMHTPKLVKEGAEGGANVFKLDYFDQEAFLAQSPQFYKQMMVIAGFERVFEVGPVFRAEQHSTRRHLNEYTSLDIEMGFIEDFHELIELETALLDFIVTQLKAHCSEELALLGVVLPDVPETLPEMRLSEAIEVLKNTYGMTHLEGDLDPEGERQICRHVYEKTGSEFLALTHYPRSKRPMYTMPSGEQETEGYDLLFRGMEITTGGLRIHQYEALVESMRLKGLVPEAYTSYLEAFKIGAPPHGGFAIGLERLTALLLGLENVRRTTLFPRDATRLVP